MNKFIGDAVMAIFHFFPRIFYSRAVIFLNLLYLSDLQFLFSSYWQKLLKNCHLTVK